jgi:uncharacterized membrane protein YcaP (DUF421 family)
MESIVRAAVVYFALLVILRISGRRIGVHRWLVFSDGG